MSGSWIIICPGLTLCGGVMLLGLQSPAGQWVDKSTHQLLPTASGSWTDVRCLWLHNLISHHRLAWGPRPLYPMSVCYERHQCPASPRLLSLSRPCSGESNKGVTCDALTTGPGPRVPLPPDIGSKCRNKCQPRSPSTSDGGKQPRVKWTLIGPLIDTLPRLTLIYLHWFSYLCPNQQQALCYISSCDSKQFCFHWKPCRCAKELKVLKMSNHLFLKRVLAIIGPEGCFNVCLSLKSPYCMSLKEIRAVPFEW